MTFPNSSHSLQKGNASWSPLQSLLIKPNFRVPLPLRRSTSFFKNPWPLYSCVGKEFIYPLDTDFPGRGTRKAQDCSALSVCHTWQSVVPRTFWTKYELSWKRTEIVLNQTASNLSMNTPRMAEWPEYCCCSHFLMFLVQTLKVWGKGVVISFQEPKVAKGERKNTRIFLHHSLSSTLFLRFHIFTWTRIASVPGLTLAK